VRPIVTLLCVLGLAAPASADPVGFFSSLVGDVQVAKPLAPGALSWHAAVCDGEVSVGDRVKTGLDASARLHVDEDTEIEIQEFHVGAAATKERSIVRHTRGRLRTIVGHAFGGETNLEVHTPTAVVGVKGTDFETRDASLPGRTRFRMCLYSGAITVGTGMGSASPHPGHCVFAEKGRPPSKEFANPDEPFEAPEGNAPDEDDFSEPVVLRPPPDPADDDPQDDDALQIFDLPEAPAKPFGGPALIALP
jgi:hypothetical protein